jgi:hypothetical protein
MPDHNHSGAEFSQGGRPGPGRDSVVSYKQRGKLLVSLACGLTQREAGIWAKCKQANISYLLRNNPDFKTELKDDTASARVHPYLRLYQGARESWRAAARLIAHMEKRQGLLTTDELLKAIRLFHTMALDNDRLDEEESGKQRGY